MQIMVLLGMYFDAVVVFVTSQTLLFRLALAIHTVLGDRVCNARPCVAHGASTGFVSVSMVT